MRAWTRSLLIGLGTSLAASGPAVAQTPPPPPPAGRDSTIDGRSFAGLDINAPAERGVVTLSAARAWTWRDGQTDRLLLDRDVRIELGPIVLSARRAVVWLEPVIVGGEEADQVAVYLVDASAGVAAASTGLSQRGKRLLVTGIIVNSGAKLRTDLVIKSRPDDPLVGEGEARFARYLAGLPGAGGLERGRHPEPDQQNPLLGIPVDDRGPLPPATRSAPMFPSNGVVSFSPGGDVVIQQEPDGAGWAAVLTGGVAVDYSRVSSAGGVGGAGGLRSLQLSAQRVVVFFDGQAQPGRSRYELGQVQGAYLEGDVEISSDDYTIRASRVFYDFKSDRAIVLDAVFSTFDQERGMPLYMRAKALRQESQNQWSGQNVTLANVGFAEPHFTIGMRQVTLTLVPGDDETGDRPRQYFDARGITARAGGVALFAWPRIRGELRPIPLRRVTVGSTGGDPVIRTTWNLYTLAGLDPAPGNSADLLIDAYTNRGVAVGADLSWRTEDIRGSLFGYFIHDNGEDRLPSGTDLRQNDEDRGLLLAEQVWRLDDHWTLFFEGAIASDETFVEAFFRDEAQSRREFANSIHARYLDDRSSLTIEARGTFNDFVVNEYLLQSLGYQTQQTPDVRYTRLGDNLFGGLVSYSSEYRFSRVSAALTEPTLEELGFNSAAEAQAVFGIGPKQSIASALRARGFNEQAVNRLDTRHEIEIPLHAGPINIVPFATARATWYDSDFRTFTLAQGSDEANDQLRVFGSVGLRVATTIQKIDESVESNLLDLHRMRHLIEPSATAWTAGTNVEQQFLPLYDEEVESLADGTVLRLGVRNTWQTQRGGDGQWRSVDWLVVDTNAVFSSSDVDLESPFGQFIESRPERSNLGDFLNNEMTMQLTDAVSLSNSVLIDLDSHVLRRASVGAVIDHGAGFTSFVEYRFLKDLRSELLNAGASYELTRKYALATLATYDTQLSELRKISTRVTRRFPQMTVELGFSFDNITGNVSLGFVVRPVGAGRETRSRVFTRDLFDRTLRQPEPTRRGRLDIGPFADQ